MPERTRILIDKQTPAVFHSYLETAKVVRAAALEAGLDRRLLELVNTRVSQLNGCAYCLDVHVAAALKHGETTQRLAVLPAWRESGLFDEREQAALSIAEAVTDLPPDRELDEDYDLAREVLTDDELSMLIWVALTINAFNRVSILSRHQVRPRPEEQPPG